MTFAHYAHSPNYSRFSVANCIPFENQLVIIAAIIERFAMRIVIGSHRLGLHGG